MITWLKKNKFFASAVCLTFLLRLPSLFEPYWYGDEGIYLTLGLGIRKGLLLYRDIYDNKPPLIYLLAGLAGSQFWFRFMLLISVLASISIFSGLLKIFFPKKPSSQKIALILFCLFSCLPLIEGNIANAEIFQLLPVLAALFLLFEKNNPSGRRSFLAGLLFSLAILFKIPAIFDLAALAVFLVFFSQPKKLLNLEKNLFYLLAGVVLPILLTMLFFAANNYLKEFVQIAFMQNLGYLSSWQTGSHQISLLKSGLFQKGLLLLGFLAVLFWWKRKYSSRWVLFSQIWFVFALFAALLSNRPYAHYLIQILPSFCLLIASLFNEKGFVKYLGLALLLGLAIISFKMRFWIYPVFSYYRNFGQYALGQKSLTDYFAYFDKKVPQTYEIAAYLLTHTKENEPVFVWGDEPYLFPLCRRLPPGRMTTAYHILDFKKTEETLKSLKENPPVIIVFDQNKKGLYPELESLILNYYLKVKTIGKMDLFRRLDY